MVSNYFLLPSAVLLTKMDCAVPCPCPKHETISLWNKTKDTSKIQAPTARGHFKLTWSYRGLSCLRPQVTYCTTNLSLLGEHPAIPVPTELQGLQKDRAEALDQSWWPQEAEGMNIGWVRPAEDPAQRFWGKYSLHRWPGRRLCSSSPDTRCRSLQAGLAGELQPCEFMSETHHQACATAVFCITAID